MEVHDLRTRGAGRIIIIEFHLVVPAAMTVAGAHIICDRLETLPNSCRGNDNCQKYGRDPLITQSEHLRSLRPRSYLFFSVATLANVWGEPQGSAEFWHQSSTFRDGDLEIRVRGRRHRR